MVRRGDKVKVVIPVTNDGNRDGLEAVLLYVSDPVSRITRPVKELRRFDKKFIRKGETVNFEFVLDVYQDFSYPDAQGNRKLEAGEIILSAGDKKVVLEVKK